MWMSALKYIRMRYDVPDDEEPTRAQFNTVYAALNKGTIPGTKQGGRWFVKMEVTNGKNE